MTGSPHPASVGLRPHLDLWGPTAHVTVGNVASRVSGLVRVLAVGAALGTTYLGNTYQSANLVSNLLFELLAAGMLSSVLVPPLVAHLETGRQDQAERLAGAVLGVALAALAVVTALGLLARPWVMRALTAEVADAEVRAAEIRLGSFLLVLFLPQVLLYAVGAVATALLHSARRFTAAALAPVANNLAVVATMAVFWAMRGGAVPSLDLPLAQRLVLGAGTTAGVLAMTAVPLLALRRAGLRLRPRWEPGHPGLRALGRAGLWAAAALAVAQVLIFTTLVLANRVEGGVVAYHIAFALFLLPHAVLAHPVTTTLYPALAAAAADGRWREYAAAVASGARTILFWTLPATALLAVLALPALRLVRLGALDADGARLVAAVVAAYAVGIAGYAGVQLLTRALYAAGDARAPAVVGLAVAAGGSALMLAWFAAASGATGRMVAVGLSHSVAMVAGAATLLAVVRHRVGQRVPVAGALARGLAATAVAGAAALVASAGVERALGGGGRVVAAVTLAAAAGAGLAAYLGAQRLLGAPELKRVRLRPALDHR